MREIKMFESVTIKPGTYPSLSDKELKLEKETIGAVVEILGNQEYFIIDIGSSPKDWDTIDVSREDIVEVL